MEPNCPFETDAIHLSGKTQFSDINNADVAGFEGLANLGRTESGQPLPIQVHVPGVKPCRQDGQTLPRVRPPGGR